MMRTAVIGCGRVSRFHADAYKKLDKVELVAGVEINQERKKVFSEKYRVPVYETIDELLANQQIDLASVATPSDLHFGMTMELMQKKINVIVEKPICLTVGQGRKLLEEERSSGMVASTCFQNRFNQPVEWLIKTVKEGRMGRIFLGAVCVRWYRDKNYFKDEWHGNKKRSGGGVLITQAIHHVDLLRLIMGAPSKITGYEANVRKYGQVEEALVSTFRYKSGALAIFEASVLAYPYDIEASLTLIGEKGTVKLGGRSLNKIEYGFLQGTEIPKWINLEDPVSVYGTSHISLIKDVVKAIEQGRKPKVRLRDGVETLKLVNRIYSVVS